MENLGDRLRQLRKEKGWAQEDLARHIDVSLSTVQRWEHRGDKAVHPTRLARKALRQLGLEGV
ncbi:hypothetical protein LCGC14_1691570 [marine sediment metagenome]|uniref:HTH cro/C1-type domain-containing protein n=1 Tax=marine sediment metagenome TaxID=412755 RepID=A0A0F9I898_9ZZZZ